MQKHLKKHRLDLKEYVAKFDPDENGEKFVLIREWIDREEFRKAIAEDPWKPNLGEKGSSSDTERLRTVEEVVVLEQSPRVYLDPAQSEEFHVQSTASQEEKSAYSKSLLSNDFLIAESVRNLDPENKNGASFCQIVAFISLHFPYYDLHLDTCRQFVKKAYGLKNPDEEEEPAGTFRIRPAVMQRLYADIAPILQKDKAEIEKAMLHPKFLDVMVQRFLEGEQYCRPRQKARLPYGMMQLSLLAFMALKHPASLEQIIIYLLFLFPGFCTQHETFRARFREEASCQPEVEKVVRGREERFTIRREAYPAVVKVLRLFTSSRAVFEALKVSIFDEAFINVLFPGLKVTEDGPASLPAKAVNMTTSVGQNNGTMVATNIATAVQPTQADIKPPIPCDILIYIRLVKWAMEALDVYTLNTGPGTPARAQPQQTVRTKEEKEVLEHFAGVFALLNPLTFKEVFSQTIDYVVERIYKNYAQQIMANSFLANNVTSPIFATILVEYLLDRMHEMGSNMERSNLYLKLFKLVFGSVSLFAAENEQMLKPHLHQIVNRTMELAITAKEPYN